MAEPFKNSIDLPLLHTAAAHLRRVWPRFPTAQFLDLAGARLDQLELKQRVVCVGEALAATLPDDFDRAAGILEASLAPATDQVELAALQPGPAGLAGWIVWPMTEFVARQGHGQPDRALRALHAMTQRFTAEFALRPFLRTAPKPTFAVLRRWVDDPSPHVRRLVSEGSRPRLPWGERLQALVRDPSPTLPLLRRLQDDPSDYVRRSVANHLNDIAKDHPDLVAEWLEQHLPAATAARRALLERAARTLVKQGHRRTLRALGFGAPLRGTASLAIAPARVPVGGEVVLAIRLASAAAVPQPLVVDYVVHRVLADGSTAPKVWKGQQLLLGPQAVHELQKRHSLRPVTTRRDYPGRHRVELLVNGAVVAEAAFTLVG